MSAAHTRRVGVLMSLHDAVLAGDVRLLNQLLDDGAMVNEPNQYRSTPLLYAAKTDQLDVAVLLIKRGAQVNMFNHSKTTALHCAASSGHLAMCQLLVQHGANVSTEDEDCDTPLCVATEGGWPDVVTFLKQAKLKTAEAELRTAMENSDARKLSSSLEKAEDEEVVGSLLLSQAHDLLAKMRRPPQATIKASDADAARGPSELVTAEVQADDELAMVKLALEEATERLKQEGEAHTHRLLFAVVTGAVFALGLLALSGRRQRY